MGNTMSEMPPVNLKRQPSLSQQVVDDLRQRILNAGLRPGASLPSERALCEHYGVSRTVIREAVKILEAKHLLKAVPGSGIIVAEPDLTDVADTVQLFMRQGSSLRYDKLHEVRIFLETAVAGQSAERATDESIAELYRLCDDIEDARGDLIRASTIDFDFHRKIAEATGNEFFVMMFDVLGNGLMEIRVATFAMDSERFDIVAKAHRKIVDGMRAKDPDLAIDAMREHLLEVKTTWDAHPELVKEPPQEPLKKLF